LLRRVDVGNGDAPERRKAMHREDAVDDDAATRNPGDAMIAQTSRAARSITASMAPPCIASLTR